MADFPSHPDAIEPAWLGERLRAAGVVRDAEITALSWVPIGTGQVGDSARLTLTYDRPGAGPARRVSARGVSPWRRAECTAAPGSAAARSSASG